MRSTKATNNHEPGSANDLDDSLCRATPPKKPERQSRAERGSHESYPLLDQTTNRPARIKTSVVLFALMSPKPTVVITSRAGARPLKKTTARNHHEAQSGNLRMQHGMSVFADCVQTGSSPTRKQRVRLLQATVLCSGLKRQLTGRGVTLQKTHFPSPLYPPLAPELLLSLLAARRHKLLRVAAGCPGRKPCRQPRLYISPRIPRRQNC